MVAEAAVLRMAVDPVGVETKFKIQLSMNFDLI